MNHTGTSDRRLEAFKIFPYVAWTVTVLFSIFVYNITTELRDITRDLQLQTQQLQEKVDTPISEIEDFDKPAKKITQ